MDSFSADCLIMVICSWKYDEAEYIRDYSTFLEEVEKQRVQDQIVRCFSLEQQTQLVKRRTMRAIEEVIDNNAFVMGDHVSKFERAFARYLGCRHAVGVSNGCAALKMAISSLKLARPKVLVQANTYVAVPLVCEDLGIAHDVIDIDDDLLLDLDKLETYLERNGGDDCNYIVVVVHLYGNCVNMDKLVALQRRFGFKLVEDAAQAHGSEYHNQKLGTFGDAGCFSFYPSKNLGAFGEAGAVVTNDDSCATFCRSYRNYGSIRKYEWEAVGANERMDNIQGAVLSIKLEYLKAWNDRRSLIADAYVKHIRTDQVRVVVPNKGCMSNYHLLVVLAKRRDSLKSFLEGKSIDTAIHYPRPFYQTPAYSGRRLQTCETMERLKDSLLSLPMYPELDLASVRAVCAAINEFYM